MPLSAGFFFILLYIVHFNRYFFNCSNICMTITRIITMNTNPARIDGLAAGKITFITLFIPFNSNVAALSRYRLSIVMIPVMVANNVAHTIL